MTFHPYVHHTEKNTSRILLHQLIKVGITSRREIVIPVVKHIMDGEHGGGRRAWRFGLGVGEGETVAAARIERLRGGAGRRECAAPAALGRDLPMCAVGLAARLEDLDLCSIVDLRLCPHAIICSCHVSIFRSPFNAFHSRALSFYKRGKTYLVRRTEPTTVLPDAQPIVRGQLTMEAPQARPVQPTALGAMIWNTRS